MTFGGNEQINSWQKYEIYLTFSKRLHLHSLIFISDTKRVSKSRSEAPDDAVVIAVPWPQNEAFSWTKHSIHVPWPRQQSITWPGFFRFDMLRPIMLLLVNLRCQWGNKCYHGPGLCTTCPGPGNAARLGPNRFRRTKLIGRIRCL